MFTCVKPPQKNLLDIEQKFVILGTSKADEGLPQPTRLHSRRVHSSNGQALVRELLTYVVKLFLHRLKHFLFFVKTSFTSHYIECDKISFNVMKGKNNVAQFYSRKLDVVSQRGNT